jgi:pyruvate dehydrogenase E2 component (dihydrolipoamide acetyltransferase)
MEEGTIISWLKADGDEIAKGDELVEIETDKANTTFESPAAGTLTIVAAAGETLAVGAVMGRLGGGASTSDETLDEVPAAPHRRDGVRATPLARKIAAAHGLDLNAIDGTGPGGRITRADAAARAGVAVQSPRPVAAPPELRVTAPPSPPDSSKGAVMIEELSRLQQVVARRTAEAKATAPHFQVQTEVAMGAALRLRAELKELGGEATPSINDLIVKAAALALRNFPRANGSYVDGRFELYADINVGVAVAARDALVVPTVTGADRRSLGSIAMATRRLAARVRERTITPPELSGATFTVSNLGMYGMTAITPVINLPQAAILGVGASRAVPTLADGRLTERELMTLTLSCDHRILYGAEAAGLLSAIRAGLEQPSGLLL